MHFDITKFIEQVLQEDISDASGKLKSGDHTSLACIPADEKGNAKLICKQDGIIAGVALAEIIFQHIDEDIQFEKLLNDGTPVKETDVAFKVYGNVQSVLRAE